MSKRTVVSDYIKNKLNNIKKDSFLEELCLTNLSFSSQQEIILDEINSIYKYIRMIKENKKCYELVNDRKILCKPVKEYISSLRKIINKYYDYLRYLRLLERYQTRKDLIEKRIEFESVEIALTKEEHSLLNSISRDNINNIEFSTLGNIAKYLIKIINRIILF